MSAKSSPMASVQGDSRKQQVRAAQVGMLYSNVDVGVLVTVVAAAILGRLQWAVIPHLAILGWLLCMFLVAAARFTLGRLWCRAAPSGSATRKWSTAFTIGAGLAGTGWGAASILLYPENQLEGQVFLAYILGGMLLGAAPLL